MAPEDSVQEPAKFRDSTGAIVLVGPDAPVGKKISGLLRARADVFRRRSIIHYNCKPKLVMFLARV